MRAGDCIHFTGIQHACCEAGVRYKDVETFAPEGTPGMRLRLPCLPKPGVESPPCASFRAMTREEDEAREAKWRARLKEIGYLLAAGKCFICQAPIEPSKIVGRCKYASCGHRLGQV